ncbi:hypothetical protein NIASO_01710 [Niabella soli DSM 19437]|uniref:Uncharacterized protein n=1 Tax=Niabella soli DSM 19437 TaxID=929713 RepID=W0F5J7_9BACT|nr:hypothetical protein NIASO_01710 [Niabella soli DSM 19437]
MKILFICFFHFEISASGGRVKKNNEREMLKKKGGILPCAGITLIRFTGIISAVIRLWRNPAPREH